MLLTYLPSPPHPPSIVGDLRKIYDVMALTMRLRDFAEKVFKNCSLIRSFLSIHVHAVQGLGLPRTHTPQTRTPQTSILKFL